MYKESRYLSCLFIAIISASEVSEPDAICAGTNASLPQIETKSQYRAKDTHTLTERLKTVEVREDRKSTVIDDIEKLKNRILMVRSSRSTNPLRWDPIVANEFFLSRVYDNKVYLFSKAYTKFNMWHAHKHCNRRGGDLFVGNTIKEIHFVGEYVNQFGTSDPPSYYTAFRSKYSPGEIKGWYDGFPIRLIDDGSSPENTWWGGFTDNRGFCATITWNETLGWAQLKGDICYRELPYICEVPVIGNLPPEEMKEHIHTLVRGLRAKVDNITKRVNEEFTHTYARMEQAKEDIQRMNTLVIKVASAEKTLQWNFSISTQFFLTAFYKQKIYLFSKTNAAFDFEKAHLKCETFGGYLLQVDNHDELRYVGKYAERFGKKNYIAYYTGYHRTTIDAHGGHFVHRYTGEALEAGPDWFGNQRDRSGRCLCISSYHLLEASCSRKLPYICEVPQRLRIDMIGGT